MTPHMSCGTCSKAFACCEHVAAECDAATNTIIDLRAALAAEQAAHAVTRAEVEGERRAHQKTNLYMVQLETQVEILRNNQGICLDNQSSLVVQVRTAETRAEAAEAEAGRLRGALLKAHAYLADAAGWSGASGDWPLQDADAAVRAALEGQ